MKCPECNEEVENFIECDLYCEDCGDHSGYRCPHCDAAWDHVWQDEIYDLIQKYQEGKNA